MEDFLARVRQNLDAQAPHLRPLFDVMAGEARFARAWLDEDLKRLPKAAPILELGGRRVPSRLPIVARRVPQVKHMARADESLAIVWPNDALCSLAASTDC